ncbi:MAG: hypothetical protein ACQGVK_22335 [Myxococcota bacterium]
MSDELETLRSQVEADPGHPAFPAWVEWLRRQGRLDEALAAAEAGLEDAPDRAAGRVAQALVLLDRGDVEGARSALGDIIAAGMGAEILASAPPSGAADRLERAEDDSLEADEIDQAFEQAESRPDEMVSANDIAERALEQALGSAVETDAAAPWPAEEADLGEPDAAWPGLAEPLPVDAARALDDPDMPVAVADPETASADRARVIATLEQWLQNLRRTAP